MLIGVGLDLADVQFWRDALANPATAVVTGTFTESERRYAQDTDGDPAEHLAARFAAKEAFVKALGATRRHRAPLTPRLDPRTVEVVRDAYGRPALSLHDEAEGLAGQLGVQHIWLSLTHTAGTAGAVVVLEG